MMRVFITLFLLGTASAALAQAVPPLAGPQIPHTEPAAIDFSQPITDPDGKPSMIDPRQPDLGFYTLKFIAVHALSGLYDDEKNLAGEKKAARGWLAQKISYADKPLLLTAENVADVKLVIGKAYSPWVIAQAWAMLDPASKPKD